MYLDKDKLVKICIFWYKAKQKQLVPFNYSNKILTHYTVFHAKAKQVGKFKKCHNFHTLIFREFTTIRLKKRKCS